MSTAEKPLSESRYIKFELGTVGQCLHAIMWRQYDMKEYSQIRERLNLDAPAHAHNRFQLPSGVNVSSEVVAAACDVFENLFQFDEFIDVSPGQGWYNQSELNYTECLTLVDRWQEIKDIRAKYPELEKARQELEDFVKNIISSHNDPKVIGEIVSRLCFDESYFANQRFRFLLDGIFQAVREHLINPASMDQRELIKLLQNRFPLAEEIYPQDQEAVTHPIPKKEGLIELKGKTEEFVVFIENLFDTAQEVAELSKSDIPAQS